MGPSPEWLVRRLESVGQRSINNIVDITNFVLHELGHLWAENRMSDEVRARVDARWDELGIDLA